MKKVERVLSGCSALDQLLNGGIEKGHITELYGNGGSGKTNVCMLIAISISRSGKKVIYIDSEGISVDRLMQVLGDEAEKVMKNVLFFKPLSFEEQENYVEKAAALAEEMEEIDAILVDSFTEFYRAELSGDNPTSSKNSLLRQLSVLNNISRKRNIPIVVTNQVYMDIESKEIMPIGGYILDHMAKTIVKLKKAGEGLREATIQKHRSIKEGKKTYFRITDSGLESVEE